MPAHLNINGLIKYLHQGHSLEGEVPQSKEEQVYAKIIPAFHNISSLFSTLKVSLKSEVRQSPHEVVAT